MKAKARVNRGMECLVRWPQNAYFKMQEKGSLVQVEENKFLLVCKYERWTVKMQNHRNKRFGRVSSRRS